MADDEAPKWPADSRPFPRKTISFLAAIPTTSRGQMRNQERRRFPNERSRATLCERCSGRVACDNSKSPAGFGASLFALREFADFQLHPACRRRDGRSSRLRTEARRRIPNLAPCNPLSKHRAAACVRWRVSEEPISLEKARRLVWLDRR